MKVLLINGSPHVDGVIALALKELSDTLNRCDIETEIIHVGNKNIRGCIACRSCKKTGKCVFDDCVNEIAFKLKDADGLVVGAPVYYGSANSTVVSLLTRLFYSINYDLSMKVGASVVSARRSGCTATFDELNKFFTISGMPIVSSTYWNNIHGNNKEDGMQDLEGLQVMRNLGKNMAFLIKSIALGKEKYGEVELENNVRTNFIR
ncbi:MAG TPA: flavodoxin family protein [Firmicutes bacterium]|nr:flavodoxin family protein [Bacillota bacterium]HAX00905.1 flavodoxin family protein [Bacillota bacterium]